VSGHQTLGIERSVQDRVRKKLSSESKKRDQVRVQKERPAEPIDKTGGAELYIYKPTLAH
jgi:hypothetical protein